jgi:uncharacterized protein YegL
MNQDYTHAVILLDRSGSMAGCWQDTVGSLENFLSEQKKLPGKMTISFYMFDNTTEQPISFVNVKEINSLANLASPRGSTALYDAFVLAVDSEGQRLAKLPENERPYKVLYVTLTDDGENASRKHTVHEVRERLAHQRDKYGWNFIFMGADFDAEELATHLGSSPQWAINYIKGTERKTSGAFNNLVSSYRTSSSNNLSAQDMNSFKAEVK